MPAIEVNNYTKKFKNFVATKNVSFSVGYGIIHGFIGPNGSGKTTTIKAMIGAYTSKKGEIKINGNIAGTVKANSLIGYIPERASFPKHLNCLNYLITMGGLSGLRSKYALKKANEILENLGLLEYKKRKPITFSSGMQKKLLLAQALITDPDILILDEPAANLDPTARKELFLELIKLRNRGKTILISSHILAELERLITEVTFIYMGEVIFTGSINKIEEGESDVFIKTNNNKLVLKFIKGEYPKYKVIGDIDTEIIVQDLSVTKVTKLFREISSLPKIIIKSLRANDLQSIYDKLIHKALLKKNRKLDEENIIKEKKEDIISKKPMNKQPITKKTIAKKPMNKQQISKKHLTKKRDHYIIQKSRNRKGWELKRGGCVKATFVATTKKEVEKYYREELKSANNTILVEKLKTGKISKTHKIKKLNKKGSK